MAAHTLDIRIYYEDTDAGGVVYHASYLRFAERARTEFLRELGYQNSALEKEHGILFVVRHIDIEYVRPAFLDDYLTVKTQTETVKNSSFIMKQTFFRDKDLIADMRVSLVCVAREPFRAVRLPDEIKRKFEGQPGRNKI